MKVLSLSGVIRKDCIAIHYKHNFGCTITNPLANHIKEKIRLLKPFCLEIA